MPNFWTLATGGVEKDLASWKVNLDLSVRRQSKGRHTATLRTVENFDPAATNWSFKQHAVVYQNRTANAPGSGPFQGGTIFFQGYFDDPQQEATGERQNIVYRLHSVWWLFERNLFAQYTNQFTGFSPNLNRVVGVSVAAGGINYKANDVLTATGGVGTAATFQVVAVGAGGAVVLVVATNGGGSYGTNPPSPNAVDSSQAHGSGCQLSFTFQPAPVLTKKVVSEIYLGEDLHAAGGFTGLWPNGNGDQVGEVLDWMNETYNPTKRGAVAGRSDAQDVVQKGRIDPHTQMPVTRVNTVFCSEAIQNCLRWDPDCVVVEDPTTTPPTLHFRKLGRWNYATVPPTFLDYTNLPEVVVNISAAQEREIVVQGQASKQVPGVIIYYKSVNQINNSIYPATQVDMFPNDGSISDYTPEVSRHTVALLGSKVVQERAVVRLNTAVPWSLMANGVATDQATWWLGHDNSLADPAVDPATVAVAGLPTIVDDSGNPIQASFASELASGLPDWTGQSAVRARVSQLLTHKRYRDSTHKVLDAQPNNRMHTMRVTLTTAAAQLYTGITSFATAEIVPQNVAESVYRSLAQTDKLGAPVPLYSGRITLLDSPLRTPVDTTGTTQPSWLGCRLRLVGPNHTFSNLAVQSVEQQPAYGATVLEFGPGPALDIDLWIELARATRGRITWDFPSNRGDGGSSPSGSAANVDTGATTPAGDTSHGAGGSGYDRAAAPA